MLTKFGLGARRERLRYFRMNGTASYRDPERYPTQFRIAVTGIDFLLVASFSLNERIGKTYDRGEQPRDLILRSPQAPVALARGGRRASRRMAARTASPVAILRDAARQLGVRLLRMRAIRVDAFGNSFKRSKKAQDRRQINRSDLRAAEGEWCSSIQDGTGHR